MRGNGLFGVHLSDDQLMEIYVLAADDEHLAACDSCRARYRDLARVLDVARADAQMEADAVFPSERLDEQRYRILRRLDRPGHPADVLRFPIRSYGQPAVRRLMGPVRRWVAAAAVAGLVAGLFLGFAVDRHVGSAPAQFALTEPERSPAAAYQDEQILTEIEDVLSGPTRRVVELRTLDAITTPPDFQEASFVPR